MRATILGLKFKASNVYIQEAARTWRLTVGLHGLEGEIVRFEHVGHTLGSDLARHHRRVDALACTHDGKTKKQHTDGT